MRAGVSFVPSAMSESALIQCAQDAEELGFDCCWLTSPDDDVVATVAALAQSTRRIAIGTGVLPIATCSEEELVDLVQQLVECSGYRFVCGLGIGLPPYPEHSLTRMRGAVRAVRAATAERQVPLYIGALSPRMLRLTGALADGWLASTYAPYEPLLSVVRDAAAGAGRAAGSVDLCVPVTADTNVAASFAAARNAGATGVRVESVGDTSSEKLRSLERIPPLVA